MVQRPKHRSQNFEILRGNHRGNLYKLGFVNNFLDMTQKAQTTTT